MFLRCQRRTKDGKVHKYWSILESRRLRDGRVAQRQVLYLGEIKASQRKAWRKTIEVQDGGWRRQLALFPAGSMPCDDVDAVGVRLSQLRLERPRQRGACWLAQQLWQPLELDSCWRSRQRPSREGTRWLKVLETLVAYRFIDPGSEWRLHRRERDVERLGFDMGSVDALVLSHGHWDHAMQAVGVVHPRCRIAPPGRKRRLAQQALSLAGRAAGAPHPQPLARRTAVRRDGRASELSAGAGTPWCARSPAHVRCG